MLDIDMFKGINDIFGHSGGDRVLQHLAGILTENTRGIDIAARYGGEEFILILPGTPVKGAAAVAEKIREITEQSRVITADNQIINYTVSLGVASRGGEAGFEDLVREANSMLYKSKDEGRNMVSVMPGNEEEEKKEEN